MAIHVQSNHRSTLVSPKNNPDMYKGEALSMAGMQKLVKGQVNIVPLHTDVIVDNTKYTHMGFNTECGASNQEVNLTASKIAVQKAGLGRNSHIIGDAILFEAKELI